MGVAPLLDRVCATIVLTWAPRSADRSGRSICRPIVCPRAARGYEIGKGQFLLIEDAELEAIEIESTHTIDIDSFVPRSEIDQRFFDTPYYIAPNEPVGQEAFAVIREAMRSKALVALGRIVLAKRERVMALEPYEKGLLGTTLHYP